MADIAVLPQSVADKIAAGEVAERPSAVVKELVENSLDAGADKIEVEIQNGGVKYIRVMDNGCGIPSGQTEIAFLRHATSKLKKIEDLYEIGTMGFRGEALASICSVATVRLITRTENEKNGTLLEMVHGKVSAKDTIACNVGTIMEVSGLFENIPARMKFLKKDSTEAGYVADIASRIAMANPHVSFKCISDGKEIFSTNGDGELKNVILNIYGLEYAKALYDVNYESGSIRITGVCGKAELSRGNRSRQTVFINGRYVKNHVISKVCEEAYRNRVMVGRFPFFVLNIEIPPSFVDVNVHPAKTEVKIADEKKIFGIVYSAVSSALLGGSGKDFERENGSFKASTRAEDKNAQSAGDKADGKADDKTKSFPEREQIKMKLPFLGQAENRKIINDFLENTMPANAESVLNTEIVFRENDKERQDGEYGNRNEALHTGKTETSDFAAKNKDADKEFEFELPPFVVVGQVFSTYIIVRTDEKMILIDQHAAHERLRFERLLSDYRSKKRFSQMLLIPITMDLTPSEAAIFADFKQEFEDFGFDIDNFGNNSVIIRETPIELTESGAKALVAEMLEAFSRGFSGTVWQFEEKMIDMISCKGAIKANYNLSQTEMEKLAESAFKLAFEGKATCPHGRPIMVEFTKIEIERMFKRIV